MNKLLQFTDADKRSTKSECQRLVEEFRNSSQNDPAEPNVLWPENVDLFSDFLQETFPENRNETIHQELTKYENTYVCMTNDFDVLKWWESRKTELPYLYQVSSKIFCVPASSAPSERIFSVCRHALSETRSTIGKNAEKVNQLIFLHSNINQSDLNKELCNLDD